MQSYNVRQHVPSHIPDHNQFIAADKLESQKHLDELSQWTDEHEMKLNPKKCKNLIFNFTNNHQFVTALKVNNHETETVKEAKLLGTIITDDLKWSRNTEQIVKSANLRLRILHEASRFTKNLAVRKSRRSFALRLSRSKLSCRLMHLRSTRQSKLQKREALPPAAVLARAHGPRGQDKAGIGAGLSEKLDTVKGVFAGVQDKIVAKLGRVKGILGQIGGEVEDKVASIKGKLHKREAEEADQFAVCLRE